MKRCIIITAYLKKSIRQSLRIHDDDFIICADGGYELAKKEGIVPHIVIGDFDSGNAPEKDSETVIHVPAEKDDTDTLLCLKYGIETGFHVFGIVGGIGGRLDH
ncbi:MAG: thiamine diphosphokinase, partial [Anaerovorax sp.]|nr:thiamine diphosphokinase [Anaerovorax sp.]